MKIYHATLDKPSLTVFRQTKTYLQGFFRSLFLKKLSKCVFMCRNFTIPVILKYSFNTETQNYVKKTGADLEFFRMGWWWLSFEYLRLVTNKKKRCVNNFNQQTLLYVQAFNHFLEQAVRRSQFSCYTFCTIFWGVKISMSSSTSG